MKGVILAGGTASRLSPLSRVLNKHLLPVNGLPMIYYPIMTLQSSGIEDILIILGGNSVGEMVNLLQDGSELKVNITYRYQKNALGIANALGLARNYVNGTFVLMLGDNIFPNFTFCNYDDARIFVTKSTTPEKFGVAVIAGDKVTDIVEKPSDFISNDIVTGLYVYPESVFDIVDTLTPSKRGELEITDLNKALCPINYTRVESWFDVGEYNALSEADLFLRSVHDS